MGLGSNAMRITAIRSLPDVQSREAVNREDEQEQDPEEREDLDEQHVNLEVSFAYRGLPSGHSAASKAKNMHLLIEFFPSLQGLLGMKVRKYGIDSHGWGRMLTCVDNSCMGGSDWRGRHSSCPSTAHT